MIDLDNTDTSTDQHPGSEPKPCAGFTKRGTPCASPIVDQVTGYCVSHDPERVLEIAEWRVLGGKGTSVEAAVERKLLQSGDLGGLASALTKTVQELREMPTTANNANAIAGVSKAYLAVREAAMNERRMVRVLELLEEQLGSSVDVSEYVEVGDE